MEAVRDRFLEDLVKDPPALLASVWILDRVPHIFTDVRAYAIWREELARRIEVDPSSLFVTGSAAFGVSLNPNKNYRFFTDKSDIDVAVVSGHHFTLAWRTLRNLGSRRYGLSSTAAASVKDHVSNYIYWGTIATDKILHLLPFSAQWSSALDHMRTIDPTLGRTVKVRIYNDLDSLRGYQASNLKGLKTARLSAKE
jgi:hypothetical protein